MNYAFMNKYLQFVSVVIIIELLQSYILSSFSLVQHNRVSTKLTNRPVIQCKIRSMSLFAKKKVSKLISDDLLSLIETETAGGEGDSSETKLVESTEIVVDKKKDKKKDKDKKNSRADVISDTDVDLSPKHNKPLVEIQETSTHPQVVNVSSSVDIQINLDESQSVDIKLKKERAPSRVRFAESSQPDFVMMALDQVGLVLGNNIILKNATLSVSSGERVGLVGQNGGGKTTQLRILSGEIEPTNGEVVKSSRNLRIAFLRQEFIDEIDINRTLREELRSAFKEEQEIIQGIAACEKEIEKTTDNPEKMDEVLNRLQDLQEQAISRGVYSLDSKVNKIIDAMGFASDSQDSLVGTFSGGWKMRIGLAKILLQEPNILLLDEPTNHLDLDSVYWLEDFLRKQSIPMVIVSHDREFLDKVCNKIVEVEDGHTYTYQGNYSKYLDQRRARIEIWQEQYDKQQKYIKEEEQWIKKAKNDPSMFNQVKSREATLEKFKASSEIIPPPPKNKKFRFRFPPAPRCSANVVEISNLEHGYGDGKHKLLFQGVDMQVNMGERIGFVGPNGSGKSTMMKIIAGVETPRKGYSDFGSNNVIYNYFEQNQADALDLDSTVLETVMKSAPSDISVTDIRSLLGQFMFKGDDVNKKIQMLSGGEKARVSLCKMMLSPANLLLLDEPTNHLDITSKEVLEEALQHYEGALLVISHDRYFMSQVVNKIFSFRNQSVERFDMDYHDFMQLQGDEFKEKVTARYVEGDRYRITNAKPVVIDDKPSKKNFGGSGVTSGNLNKGIKNAKRFQ